MNVYEYNSWEDHYDDNSLESMEIDEGSSHEDNSEVSDRTPDPIPVAPKPRVKPYQGYPWNELIAMRGFKSLSKLATRVESRYSRRKLTPQRKRDMDNELVNRDTLDGTVLNIKSSVGQIIRWLKGASREDDSIEFNLESLCRTKVFEAWYNWALDYWNGSPQTPVNKCLAYKNLLEWLLTRESFKELYPKINKTLAVVRDSMSGLKSRVQRWKFNYDNAKQLVKRGEMLSDKQVLELNRKVWADLKRGFDKIKNNLSKTDRSGNAKLALELQTNLQILLICRLIGQRREFVAALDDEQVDIQDNGQLMIQPQREKKTRVDGHGLLQSPLMTRMLTWFKTHVRPLLGPKEGVKAWWLNTQGKPQAGKLMTRQIKRMVARHLPGTNITPASLRRQYATMFEGADWTANLDEDKFWQQIAGIMNTGVQTLNKHYKRTKSPQKQTELLDKVNWEWNQDEDIEDKMRSVEQLIAEDERPELPEKPLEEPAEFEVGEIVDKKVSKKSGVEYLVRWEGYPVEEATWERLTTLEGALEAIEQYEIRQSLDKKKKKKKEPAKKKRVIPKKKPATKKKTKRRETKKKETKKDTKKKR